MAIFQRKEKERDGTRCLIANDITNKILNNVQKQAEQVTSGQ